MTGFKNITVTEGRTKHVFKDGVKRAIMPQVKETVQTAVESERIRTGVITRYYPYLDKAEVKLDETKKTILCKILHRFGGDMVDFYTPLEYEESFDEDLEEPCIIPRASHNVCVLQIHDKDSDENLILGYYQNTDVVGFTPAKSGNIKLMSITEPNLYWIEFGPDGLNLRLPKNPSIEMGELPIEMENGDFYTKKEVDEKLKDTSDSIEGMTYRELLETTEDYKETSYDNQYYLFRGDCWTINNNFESSAAITSETLTDFTVSGTFRTINDLVGVYWNSQDEITHPYISYGERYDYTNVVLDFDYEMAGCMDFANGTVSITIRKMNGSVYYLTMNRFINNGHVHLDFNNLTLLPGNSYINEKGESVTVTEETPLRVDDIKSIMFVIIPTNFVNNLVEYTIMENVDYTCQISNIQVTNGAICNEHIPLEPHPYRLCEGYDDFYNINPKRVCKEMRKLGYTQWLDLYIGASHFYEKSGTPGEKIDATDFNHTRTEKMVLNKDVPLNKAFCAWLDCYSRELKANDCPNLVVSVSMENLQCPTDWRQRDCNGNYALTGWVPSTFFYSPCHPDVAPYMQSVSEACLDIVVANDMQPILQMGEAWWWWNEYTDPVNKSPCFYDDSTKAAYRAEFKKNMPTYLNPYVGDFDMEMMGWLNNQLCKYSDALRDVVKSDKYSDGLYTALFFPPSVTDVDRVPLMMQQVNYLKNAYNPSKLDFLQLEDYDWVIWESKHHNEVYSIGQELGFPEDRLHYFGGFVQYEKDAKKYWRLIKNSMDEAIDKDFREVFVWAGSQVRRDKKILGYDGYEFIQDISDIDKSNGTYNFFPSESSIPLDNLDVDFNLNFGISGRDDIITVETFLKQK